MFKFRLQRVLEMREKREEEAATQLAAARDAASRALEAAHALEAAQRAQLEQVAAVSGSGVSVGQLQNLTLLVEAMGAQVDDAYREVDTAQLQVRDQFAKFAAAFKDRQVLNKLREKDHLAWRSAEAQADRSQMDDIALSQFVRGGSGPTSGGSGL
jgi:flagellar protein FliJ